MVLLEEPTFPGCSVNARPVGVFWMHDEHGPDAKILTVPAHDPRYADMRELEDIPEFVRAEIGHLFDIYKELEPCADDERVRAALDHGHGLCLRHGERLAGAGRTEAFRRRLLTRLRQSAWELNEDMIKQVWDLRHEPAGRETTAWRRVPALLDGSVYLGLAEADLS